MARGPPPTLLRPPLALLLPLPLLLPARGAAAGAVQLPGLSAAECDRLIAAGATAAAAAAPARAPTHSRRRFGTAELEPEPWLRERLDALALAAQRRLYGGGAAAPGALELVRFQSYSAAVEPSRYHGSRWHRCAAHPRPAPAVLLEPRPPARDAESLLLSASVQLSPPESYRGGALQLDARLDGCATNATVSDRAAAPSRAPTRRAPTRRGCLCAVGEGLGRVLHARHIPPSGAGQLRGSFLAGGLVPQA